MKKAGKFPGLFHGIQSRFNRAPRNRLAPTAVSVMITSGDGAMNVAKNLGWLMLTAAFVAAALAVRGGL